MLSGLRTFALACLLGGLSAAGAGAEPAPGAASLNSGLERLTLRQAEIFSERSRELPLAQRALQSPAADVITAGERPREHG